MKITYHKLLDYVSEGVYPKKIKVGSAKYEWNGCDYALTTDSRKSLSDVLTNWTAKAQTTAEFIEVVQEVLTKEEKEYLSAVIKPFRENVRFITKRFEWNYLSEYIRIDLKNEYIIFPYFEEGKMYRGIDRGKPYTLEELGL